MDVEDTRRMSRRKIRYSLPNHTMEYITASLLLSHRPLVSWCSIWGSGCEPPCRLPCSAPPGQPLSESATPAFLDHDVESQNRWANIQRPDPSLVSGDHFHRWAHLAQQSLPA